MRSDEESKRFYEKTVKAAEELEIGEPELPRQRKRPSRYESESSHTMQQKHSIAVSILRLVIFSLVNWKGNLKISMFKMCFALSMPC